MRSIHAIQTIYTCSQSILESVIFDAYWRLWLKFQSGKSIHAIHLCKAPQDPPLGPRGESGVMLGPRTKSKLMVSKQHYRLLCRIGIPFKFCIISSFLTTFLKSFGCAPLHVNYQGVLCQAANRQEDARVANRWRRLCSSGVALWIIKMVTMRDTPASNRYKISYSNIFRELVHRCSASAILWFHTSRRLPC